MIRGYYRKNKEINCFNERVQHRGLRWELRFSLKAESFLSEDPLASCHVTRSLLASRPWPFASCVSRPLLVLPDRDFGYYQNIRRWWERPRNWTNFELRPKFFSTNVMFQRSKRLQPAACSLLSLGFVEQLWRKSYFSFRNGIAYVCCLTNSLYLTNGLVLADRYNIWNILYRMRPKWAWLVQKHA